MLGVSLKHLLKTRPVSSTFPATAVPEMRASRIEETSEAADVTWYVLKRQERKEKKKTRGQQGVSRVPNAQEVPTWLRGGI